MKTVVVLFVTILSSIALPKSLAICGNQATAPPSDDDDLCYLEGGPCEEDNDCCACQSAGDIAICNEGNTCECVEDCVAEGGACGAVGDCCGCGEGFVTSCEGFTCTCTAECAAEGDSCAAGQECCDDPCASDGQNNTCGGETCGCCAGQGVACTTTEDCCAECQEDYVPFCNETVCGCCGPTGSSATCESESDCCNDCAGELLLACNGGSCECCVDASGPCTTPSDCCGFGCAGEVTCDGSCGCNSGMKRRVLSKFDENELFVHVKGDERNKLFDSSQQLKTDTGLCHYPTSKYNGQVSSREECFGAENQAFVGILPEESHQRHAWIEPLRTSGRTQVADNVGIWTYESFMDEETMSAVKALVHKYGQDQGFFKGCILSPKDSNSPTPRQCFKISPEKVCAGTNEDCTDVTDPQDSELIQSWVDRMGQVWPEHASDVIPYINFLFSSGGVAPIDLHYDGGTALITMITFLSTGGAAVWFPHADVRLVPKAGEAHTWVNQLPDGSRNPMMDHAVQAHPAEAEDRLVMTMTIAPRNPSSSS